MQCLYSRWTNRLLLIIFTEYELTQSSITSVLFYSIFPHQDEFYQQLQAIRQPWHIPSDTDSDILEPPEQDKSE